ncbi:succinate dehydrogenase-ubiquinone-cytochrome b small subunit, mitochondrial precursor [Aulographum hederae CBS 113979]|uniref:Succinate dehydrogenase [ubiquinone] cytochrome b small subunit n=1 Tax=Aulographum hederae CBS 113979 TaxID=1176131 RepID=A0A6G1H5Z5_9PEZI|nr:succinate dehydrogenase-ubiquinone-cytochrome b small subunit, mitochondrial precursor [Aulographum hederae CBS 113979]
MAAIARPTIFHRACQAAAGRRMFSTTPSAPLMTSAFTTAKPLARRPLKAALLRDALPKAAAFHASGSQKILPPLPQVVKGTANDPVPVPSPHPTHGSYHWTFERLIAGGLVPLTIAPFVAGSLNPVMDATLCSLLIVHSHIGFEACIIDYFPDYRVPGLRTALMWILRIATVTVGVGLYEFETHDVGVTEAVKRIWKA